MLAMQYTVALPADYDMSIIRDRITRKGGQMDGFAGLAYKAFAARDSSPGGAPPTDNLYAPFYLWDDAAGASEFLVGPGFAALCRDFGRPRVQLWTVLASRASSTLRASTFATRHGELLPQHADLRTLREHAARNADEAVAAGAGAALIAFDPLTWTQARFELWPQPPRLVADTQRYEVGHVALGHPAKQT
jgi:hypothetical protein